MKLISACLIACGVLSAQAPQNKNENTERMAAGADLWHMSCIAGPVYCSLKVPEFPAILEIPALEPQPEQFSPAA